MSCVHTCAVHACMFACTQAHTHIQTCACLDELQCHHLINQFRNLSHEEALSFLFNKLNSSVRCDTGHLLFHAKGVLYGIRYRA